MNRTLRRLCGPAILLCASAAFAALPGCNVVGAIAGLFKPSMPIKAYHAIPRKHTVVVIVDDYRGAATSPNLCAAIATAAVHHLREDGGFKVVGADQVQDAIGKLGDRWTGKKGEKPVSAASLGAALHADTIVYANIEAAQIQLAENIYQPQVTLAVKAYDASGACLFPAGPDGENINQTGFVIASEIPARDLSASGRGAIGLAESKLAAQAGLDLAHLFYDHQPQNRADRMANN